MSIAIINGNCLDVMSEMEPCSVQSIITSPPYFGLRDYGTAPVAWQDGWIGELGQEPTIQQYALHLVEVFTVARNVLREDGTLWVNLGDSYGSGSSEKCLLGAPWRFALAMIDAGWILRQDIIWHKPNPMPESVRDRCTKSHEYVFVFAKKKRYYWDSEALAEPTVRPGARLRFQAINERQSKRSQARNLGKAPHGNESDGAAPAFAGDTRNRRSVWTIPLGEAQGENYEHFAVWPSQLVSLMILASTRANDVVLDPFSGSGATARIASSLGRKGIGIEIKPEYVEIAQARIAGVNIGLQL